MAYVVTLPCIGTKDRSCVEVCPVDCFYNYPNELLNKKYNKAPLREDDPGMLVINPDECINCGACETECPVTAICEDSGVPDDVKEFIQINEMRVTSK
jgi:NAD-dependent dihydropyrimidine dehydrogenase PreA subunit